MCAPFFASRKASGNHGEAAAASTAATVSVSTRSPGPDQRLPVPLTVATRMKYQQPVFRKPFGWPGSGLLIGTAVGRCQDGPIDELCGAVIPEPILSRLVALDQCMPRLLGMCCRMHVERIVAASDVATGCTPAKMQPPGASFVAFDTT